MGQADARSAAKGSNLPPPPKDEAKEPWTRTLLAYVWDGASSFIEQGKAARRGDAKDQMLKMDLGAADGCTVELRFVDGFKPTEMSFTAFVKIDGEEIAAGTAALHEDGQGYQLKLTTDVADGQMLKLKSDGPIVPASGRLRRKPNPALKRQA